MAITFTPVPYAATGRFNRLLSDYAADLPALRAFHSGFPNKDNFTSRIENRQKTFSPAQRTLLCSVLEEQMSGGSLHQAQRENLNKLKQDNCFSVSCGHQLSIAGGPQYMAFKILSTLKLAEELKGIFPEMEFVPIFWLAGEDHDLEEILSFRFFSQPYRMELEGTGAVGRLSCKGIAEQLQVIKDFPDEMSRAYDQEDNLAMASRHWLQQYFGEKGLLILDPDRTDLKASFLPEMLKEFSSGQVKQLMEEETKKLETLGYEAQLHPRELNLFYLNGNTRTRLIHRDGGIALLEGELKWSLEEAITHFTEHPEELSPNACLRPLYSQKILPDAAFIGGPAEIAYWLQLKSTFDYHGIFFPLLIPRFSALLLPENRAARMEKLGIQPEELFEDEARLRRKLALGDKEIPAPSLRDSFSGLLAFAAAEDASLVPALEAEISRMENMADGMAKRIRKAAEKKAETAVKQLENLLEFCFPQGGLLERSESWLSLLVQNPSCLDEIYSAMSALDFRFQVLLQKPGNEA